MDEKHKEMLRKHLSPIVNGKIVGMIFSQPDYFGQVSYGLQIKKGEKFFLAWIDRDEGSNGPGFLDIQEDKEA